MPQLEAVVEQRRRRGRGRLRSREHQVQVGVERAHRHGDLRDELVGVLPVAAVISEPGSAVLGPDHLHTRRQVALPTAVHHRILGGEEVEPRDRRREIGDLALVMEVAPEHHDQQSAEDRADSERQTVRLMLVPDPGFSEESRGEEPDRQDRADGSDEGEEECGCSSGALGLGQADQAGPECDEQLDLPGPRLRQRLVRHVPALGVGDHRDPIAALLAKPVDVALDSAAERRALNGARQDHVEVPDAPRRESLQAADDVPDRVDRDQRQDEDQHRDGKHERAGDHCGRSGHEDSPQVAGHAQGRRLDEPGATGQRADELGQDGPRHHAKCPEQDLLERRRAKRLIPVGLGEQPGVFVRVTLRSKPDVGVCGRVLVALSNEDLRHTRQGAVASDVRARAAVSKPAVEPRDQWLAELDQCRPGAMVARSVDEQDAQARLDRGTGGSSIIRRCRLVVDHRRGTYRGPVIPASLAPRGGPSTTTNPLEYRLGVNPVAPPGPPPRPCWRERRGSARIPRMTTTRGRARALLVLITLLILPISILWAALYLAFGSPVGFVPLALLRHPGRRDRGLRANRQLPDAAAREPARHPVRADALDDPARRLPRRRRRRAVGRAGAARRARVRRRSSRCPLVRGLAPDLPGLGDRRASSSARSHRRSRSGSRPRCWPSTSRSAARSSSPCSRPSRCSAARPSPRFEWSRHGPRTCS